MRSCESIVNVRIFQYAVRAARESGKSVGRYLSKRSDC